MGFTATSHPSTSAEQNLTTNIPRENPEGDRHLKERQ